jgi:hypothetical protein
MDLGTGLIIFGTCIVVIVGGYLAVKVLIDRGEEAWDQNAFRAWDTTAAIAYDALLGGSRGTHRKQEAGFGASTRYPGRERGPEPEPELPEVARTADGGAAEVRPEPDRGLDPETAAQEFPALAPSLITFVSSFGGESATGTFEVPRDAENVPLVPLISIRDEKDLAAAAESTDIIEVVPEMVVSTDPVDRLEDTMQRMIRVQADVARSAIVGTGDNGGDGACTRDPDHTYFTRTDLMALYDLLGDDSGRQDARETHGHEVFAALEDMSRQISDVFGTGGGVAADPFAREEDGRPVDPKADWNAIAEGFAGLTAPSAEVAEAVSVG